MATTGETLTPAHSIYPRKLSNSFLPSYLFSFSFLSLSLLPLPTTFFLCSFPGSRPDFSSPMNHNGGGGQRQDKPLLRSFQQAATILLLLVQRSLLTSLRRIRDD